MALIKAQSAPQSARIFSMADIEDSARQRLERAHQQADILLADAQVEADALRKAASDQGQAEGFERGFENGLKEGHAIGHQQALNEFRQQFSELVGALGEMAVQIDRSRQKLESQATGEVVQLAIAIAERITKRRGIVDPQVLLANLGESMRLVVRHADLRIAIHSSQKKLLEQVLPQLKLKWPGLEHVHLVEDEQVAPGGCRLDSANGTVDADLGTQLDRIVAELVPQDQGAL